MLVGIDIGSHKVTTLVGEELPGGGIRVLGIGHAPAAGIRDGEIVHVKDAAGAIAMSVERAERIADVTVTRAVVGITGRHISSTINNAAVPCGRRPRSVEEEDLQRLLEVAGTVPLPEDREVLHVLPRAYHLDDGATVISPLGMAGCRLGATVLIVTGATAALSNIRKCLELAEVTPIALVMSTLAAAEASLSTDERELGAFVVDLGVSCTGIACFVDGAAVHCSVLEIGGKHMTSDLAIVLQTPIASAERIKTTHGHVLPDLDDGSAEVEVESFGDNGRRRTTRRYVSEILAARADEVAEQIWQELEEHDLATRMSAGAVLVGGGSELGGLATHLCGKWSVPVRQGRPFALAGLADAARGPSHAGAVGLLAWQARNVVDGASAAERTNGQSNGRGLLGWIKDAFLPRDGDGS